MVTPVEFSTLANRDLIWVQIVYKGYQLTTNVAACKERVKMNKVVNHVVSMIEFRDFLNQSNHS